MDLIVAIRDPFCRAIGRTIVNYDDLAWSARLSEDAFETALEVFHPVPVSQGDGDFPHPQLRLLFRPDGGLCGLLPGLPLGDFLFENHELRGYFLPPPLGRLCHRL